MILAKCTNKQNKNMGTKIKFLLLSVLMSNILHSQSNENVNVLKKYVTEATAKLAKSLSQSLSEKVQAPFSNLGTVVTFVGGIATFWSNKTKNPWIIAAGTTATYIGVATTAMVMVLGGVEPKDMVIEFPQKENRTFGGVYTNDYRNKKSLENTPDWGTKN